MYAGSGCFPGKVFSDTYIIFYLESDEYIEARQSQEPPWAGTVWEAPQWCTMSFSGRCMQWTYWQHSQHSSLTFFSSESQFCLGYCSKCFPNAIRGSVSKTLHTFKMTSKICHPCRRSWNHARVSVTVSSYTPCCRLPYAAFENTEKGLLGSRSHKLWLWWESRGPCSF